MKERPILFSSEIVRAILEGRKTQTRRVIKGEPNNIRWSPIQIGNRVEGWEDNHGKPYNCPYGIPGDRLWVRETWAVAPIAIHYRADNNFMSLADEPRLLEYESTKGWRPSIFMPRWASRILLEITNIRAERLQDISETDAILEGTIPNRLYSDMFRSMHKYSEHICAFHDLWDSINAKRGYPWESNSWVWVIEFRKVEPCTP
jgi:hypothetical protein